MSGWYLFQIIIYINFYCFNICIFVSFTRERASYINE